MRTKGWLIAGAIAIAAVAAVICVSRRRRSGEKHDDPGKGGTANTADSRNVEKTGGEVEFPLEKGDSGEEVALLQAALNAVYGAGLEVDGKFGPATEEACMQHLGTDRIGEVKFRIVVAKHEYLKKIKKTRKDGDS